MGKRAEQAKKRRRLQERQNVHKASQPLTPRSNESPSPPSLISPEDLDTAVYVLRTLAENPEELTQKSMKTLKTASYELQRVLAEGAAIGERHGHVPWRMLTAMPGSSLTSRISAALQDYRFSDALILLFEMYVRRLTPKLGAIQRWVRECDATSNADGTPGDPEAFRCLDMILRLANMGSQSDRASVGPSARVRTVRVWRARESVDGELAIWDMMQEGTLYGEFPPLQS
jgi:hypothetical protein